MWCDGGTRTRRLGRTGGTVSKIGFGVWGIEVGEEQPRSKRMNLSLALGLLALVAWIVLALVVPVGAGWVHLFLAAGVILLIRRVVTGPREW